MDESSLHDLLDSALAGEPPMGPVARNALRTGTKHRRARGAAGSAAALAVIVAGIPAATGALGTAPAPGQGPHSRVSLQFAVTDGNRTSPLQVRDVATGAVVAQVGLPAEPGSHGPGRPGDSGADVGGVATANGRQYVVALYRPRPCRSWLYQFTLDTRGQPSAVTPLRARPTVPGAELYDLAVSGNGQQLAYASVSSGPGCVTQGSHQSHVGITDISTGQTRQWSTPRSNSVDHVSVTASGSMLLYSLQLNPSVIRVIPASAPPGDAAHRGRTVIQANQFGRSQWSSFAAISPDGSTAIFSIYPPGGSGPGKIYTTDLITGHSRIVATGAAFPGLITSDPAVRHLLLYLPHHLATLNLSTGKVTQLSSGWKGFTGRITW